MLHRYNYLMSQQRLADLQREVGREQPGRSVKRQNGTQRFYHRWARQFGEQLMRWGQSLQRYSEADRYADRSKLNSGEPAGDFRSLKVVHANPMRRAKWN